MDIHAGDIGGFLRAEMTAVHQQFIHILTLRRWGLKQTADRIAEVDDVDFPNAMKIVDYLVVNKAGIELPGDSFQPGHNHREIIAAERKLEKRLAGMIETTRCSDARLSELLAAAKTPRQSYTGWLDEQLGLVPAGDGPNPDYAPETAGLLGSLLTVVEQAMIHSFVHFNSGRFDLADDAWHTSGAAMMQLTKFVSFYSAQQSAPVFKDMPASTVEYETEDALQADSELARDCGLLAAQAAAHCGVSEVKKYCRKVEGFYKELSEFAPGGEHPAKTTNPPAFRSFQATYRRYVED